MRLGLTVHQYWVAVNSSIKHMYDEELSINLVSMHACTEFAEGGKGNFKKKKKSINGQSNLDLENLKLLSVDAH